MNFKRLAALLLGLILLAVMLPATSALASDQVYLERAICINDTQIVLEFSEPIAINLKKQNAGPWICIRVLYPDNNTVTGGPREDNCLQASGVWEFVDDKQDRILWTMDIGCIYESNETVESIVNFKNDMWRYGLYQAKMYIEEIPFDMENTTGDINDNITSLDGLRHLHTNVKYFEPSWSATVCDIEFDYDYVLYREEETVPEPFGGITLGKEVVNPIKEEEPKEESEPESKPESEPEKQKEEKSDNKGLIIGCSAGGALVVIGAVVGIIAAAKKKKK